MDAQSGAPLTSSYASSTTRSSGDPITADYERWRELKRLVIVHGLPRDEGFATDIEGSNASLCSLRGRVWKAFLGVENDVDMTKYAALVGRGASHYDGDIRNDTFRTFRGDLEFAQRVPEEKLVRLLNVFINELGSSPGRRNRKTVTMLEMATCRRSAVEDKLQVGVPETISLFQKAGIKIWVLTGDKLETSLEMGKLCRVVTPKMQEVIIQGTTRYEMTQQLEKALQNSKVDTFSFHSATVIVCRASPIQKALVVELVKAGVPDVTLAVGDGANDVSMIRAAHVGVGLWVKRGCKPFEVLTMPCSSRLSYLRTTQCIDYFLYKNIVFTVPHFFYGIASAFSAQTFFCDLYITAYNVVFTALPVTIRAVMETDLLEAIAAKFPELYRFGATNIYEENFETSNPVHILRRTRLHNKVLDSSGVDTLGSTDLTTSVVPSPQATSNKRP
ncbi:hypothetical protein AM588_10002449 [Phytophthora nicotianae]|uniref:P-type ATPase C-terminal domain-containing protein n=1 Tax=Phytophthora nicotianae TaxID=4792 RepID=A0A0W8CR88_PHYNI|nr:hypothetical protein AM588_10002449 [Phytophthora nicotianae]